VDKLSELRIRQVIGEITPNSEAYAEPRHRAAYNQTRGYILGVEIACGEFSHAALAERLAKLTPKSGAGLWLVPFRGIPTDVPLPLDLIYLDASYQVIEAVEFFPSFRVSPSSPPAASVLVLPTHSIFSSHTQSGDQVAFGLAEEIEHELAQIFGSSASASAVQEAVTARENPVSSVAPALPREVERPMEAVAEPIQAEPVVAPQPWKKQVAKPKNWLLRWLAPEPEEPRKATREALSGLAAYFFTGGTPKPHEILNISATGLYVLTDERWYPGTIIQMTLKKSSSDGTRIESSISLPVKANRWGNDGVGLSFVVRDPQNPGGGESGHTDGVDRGELDQFLARIGWGNS
jgi:hypothetical protein